VRWLPEEDPGESRVRSLHVEWPLQVKVTIKNLTHKHFPQVTYARSMGWHIDPIAKTQLVTIKGTRTKLKYGNLSDNGLCSLDAGFDDCKQLATGTTNVDFVDSSPHDHGAPIKLKLVNLQPGNSMSFTTCYGVAPNEDYARAAVKAVGAKLYRFGQSSTEGTTVTFRWACKEENIITPGIGSCPTLVPDPAASWCACQSGFGIGSLFAEWKQKSNSG
jgi:hypothetical protein